MRLQTTIPALTWRDWIWDPAVLLGLAAITGTWVWIARRFPPRQSQLWYGWVALGILTLTLLSPLDHGAEFSFTLHMAQHMLLMLVVAPLLALAAPAGLLGWLRRRLVVGPLIRGVWSPIPAFIVYHVALFAWHLPVLYDAAVRVEILHLVQHVTFVLGGLAFWEVIVAPEPRLVQATLGQRMALVLAANIAGWGLSFVLALSERPIYSAYVQRGLWGLSPVDDLRLGGAVMWVWGNVIYGAALLLLFFAWMRREGR